ncbi:type I polyketide synthase [Aquimarina sp. D1M17]|uniref:type I polyketide synthase n=1 Tax=Aquimarina acroporae TaxID=2937283 RepID=UPI0020BD88B0|nr:type I polyketide synthase [Aquimarina acroporae]MCK8524321.1 type I polyketide synthase [Aquimarina acroporae]
MKNQNKPIAIVGLGCRFPGSSSSPEKFWEMLVDQTDAVIDVPSNRWDNRHFYDEDENKPGKIKARQGGFLKESIEDFDPMFFGISPMAAESLDPQERILLEVAYEAFEDAGIPIEKVKGTSTGVFVGGFTFDNYLIKAANDNKHLVNSQTALGISLTMLSNRLSYFFDLNGPSITIDTACSSSLVATHYACQSIWRGESSMALVGGVNMLLRPEVSINMSKGQFLSKHSRCKAFDSDAGGYVRGEGGGVVILKPYEDAIKDGDKIYALINGTGVNQDGHTSGITVPNGDAQTRLIQKVYKENGIDTKDVHYVEAHGTGTPVGDPIEFGALNKVLSEKRTSDDKLLVGSVKTNIGHLEAASGVAGLIKTALCLNKNQVPASLHFKNPNPALNYNDSVLKVPTSLNELPTDKKSHASINSFGYGGTNAHVVLEQYAQNTDEVTGELAKKDNFIFPIGARSKDALVALAKKYKDYLQNEDNNFAQVLSNTAYRRSHHSDRLAIVASSKDELLEKIEAFEEDILIKGITTGNVSSAAPKVVFVYTGMGPQWWKMGRDLMQTEPVFKRAIEECDAEFTKISGWSIIAEMEKPEDISKIGETYIAQPANLVIQIGLTKLLNHYGISPDAVVGHSVGEVASAYVSGALSLEDALLVSYHRSRLQHTTSGTGTMLAVGLPEEEIKDTLIDYSDVSIAAINSPKSVTLAGNEESLKLLQEKYEEMGVFNRMLKVTVPYHSPMMNPIKEELLTSLQKIKGNDTTIDLYSTVTANKISGENINNEYWWRNVRESVRFAETVNTLENDNYTIFIEVGPHPVLKNSMKECVNNNESFNFLETLNRKQPEQINFFENIAQLFTLGFSINWDRWVGKLPYLPLPSYPWQKDHYWEESAVSIEKRVGRKENVFLHQKVQSPKSTYKVEINKYFFPFLNDHVVQDRVVFPGAGYIAAGIAYYQNEISPEVSFGLENVKFHQMLVIEEDKLQDLYTSYDDKSQVFTIDSSNVGEDMVWTQRASGKFIIGDYKNGATKIDLTSKNLKSTIYEDEIYEKLSKSKLDYGPYFRTIENIQFEENELIATIKGHEQIKDSLNEFFIHPTLLDACFQSVIAFDDSEFVPVSMGKMYCHFSPGDELVCYSNLKSRTDNSVLIDMTICDVEGNVAIEIKDFKCQELVAKTPEKEDFVDDCLFTTNWIEEESDTNFTTDYDTVTYIFTDDYSGCIPLLGELQGKVVVLQPGSDFKELGEGHYMVNLEDLDAVSEEIKADFSSDVTFVYFVENDTLNRVSEVGEECLKRIKPILDLAQYCSKNLKNKLTLNLITQGSQFVHENDKIQSLESTIAHGLGRIIVNEFPTWDVRLLDFESSNGNPISTDLWRLVLSKMYASVKPYEEIAIRNNTIFKRSLQSWNNEDVELTKETVSFQDNMLQLANEDFDGFENISFKEVDRADPKEGEIEILIDNASINFKDYLKVTNKIVPESLEGSYTGNSMGCDCEGVVTRVGKGASKFKVGDRVIAIARGTFQSYTTTSELLAVKCPENLVGKGSNVVLSYLTAVYSLRDKGNLKKGDKVLIHNATGGVGMAAINYANMVGAEVYATAGTEEKRDYLKSIGINNVYSSRSLDFAKEILETTSGKGVDIVLSALPKETMHQSLSALAPYGTYLEIGKKDILDNAALPMSLFNKNISFSAIDVDRMTKEKPEEVSSILEDIASFIDVNEIESLPVKVFSPNTISEAFSLIDEGKNIGKVIISFTNEQVEIFREKELLIKIDKTYLIAGGTKGLGFEIGKWLIDKGAKNLVLLSRSGLKDPKAIETVEKIREKGVNVKAYAVDVSSLEEMSKVFEDINQNLPPIASVFHCAMVLDDGSLVDMNIDRFRKVMRPKLDGALNIYELCKNFELDNFILFSSVSSLIGNLGQANYIVANALLDSFTHICNNEGIPATTINLGVLAQSGVVARSENLEDLIYQGTGIRSFTNNQVLVGLEKILYEKPRQVGFFDIHWEVLSENMKGSGYYMFEELVKTKVGSNKGLNDEQNQCIEELLALEKPEQQSYVAAFLKEELSRILKLSKDKIQSDKGIGFLGIDSILSVELLRVINNKFAINMSSMELLTLPSVNKLSIMIIDKVLETSELELV